MAWLNPPQVQTVFDETVSNVMCHERKKREYTPNVGKHYTSNNQNATHLNSDANCVSLIFSVAVLLLYGGTGTFVLTVHVCCVSNNCESTLLTLKV